MRSRSETNKKLQFFLLKVKTYRQLSLPENIIDENFDDFCKNLPERLSWEALALAHNKAGDNILHLMGIAFERLAPRLTDLKGSYRISL